MCAAAHARAVRHARLPALPTHWWAPLSAAGAIGGVVTSPVSAASVVSEGCGAGTRPRHCWPTAACWPRPSFAGPPAPAGRPPVTRLARRPAPARKRLHEGGGASPTRALKGCWPWQPAGRASLRGGGGGSAGNWRRGGSGGRPARFAGGWVDGPGPWGEGGCRALGGVGQGHPTSLAPSRLPPRNWSLFPRPASPDDPPPLVPEDVAELVGLERPGIVSHGSGTSPYAVDSARKSGKRGSLPRHPLQRRVPPAVASCLSADWPQSRHS